MSDVFTETCEGCEQEFDNCQCPTECDQCGGEIEAWKLGRHCATCAPPTVYEDIPW